MPVTLTPPTSPLFSPVVVGGSPLEVLWAPPPDVVELPTSGLEVTGGALEASPVLPPSAVDDDPPEELGSTRPVVEEGSVSVETEEAAEFTEDMPSDPREMKPGSLAPVGTLDSGPVEVDSLGVAKGF